ncbi:alpha-L-rhamnosidase-related protein [Arthrobacter sp. KNU40]|uniref:alpha-L-rhamnosidase-related protein n=1 Tax=Arthrobacter sp. KNU40 TaxID=3447965 RepID=UPI003F5FC8B3
MRPRTDRNGYAGDYQIFIRSAAFLDDVDRFSRKWLRWLADDRLKRLHHRRRTQHRSGEQIRPPLFLRLLCRVRRCRNHCALSAACSVWRSIDPRRHLRGSMARRLDYTGASPPPNGIPPDRNPGRLQPHEQFLRDCGFHWGEWVEPGTVLDYFGICVTVPKR